MGAFEQTLGRYRLLRLLGQGGVGQVHLACSHGAAGFEKLVAVKILRPELISDPEHMRLLQQEAHIAVELQHPNIVQTLDLGEEADRFYMVMEYVRGFSLAKVLSYMAEKEARLPIALALHIFRAASRALDCVHDRMEPDACSILTHGDVSPSNLLLGSSGQIALADFGVSALMQHHPDKVAGKWSYVPPEALLGARIGHHWDLYSLGVVLYEMLTGRKAFRCESFAERAALPEACTPIRELRPEVPAALANLVGDFIAPSPADRLASATQMRRAVDAVAPGPQDVEDSYLRYIGGLFSEGDFMRSHGSLPSTTTVRRSMDPFMEATEAPTAQVRLKKPLRFGLSLAHGADRAKCYGAMLSDVLSAPIERPVRPVLLGDYQTLLDCLLRGDVDIAWMPPLLMAEAVAAGAGVLAVAQREGRVSYSGAIIVRRDSEVHHIEDLRTKSIAWVDRDSASGYEFPRRLLEERLGPLDDLLPGSSFHGSHRAVCEAVLKGWADAGATYVVCNTSAEVTGCAWTDFSLCGHDELRVVCQTEPIPGDCIAHRPNFSERWFDDLRAAFASMGQTEAGRELLRGAFHADAFVDGDIAAYEAIGKSGSSR